MSTTFEDRLERELVDAARRRARAGASAAGAGSPARARSRRALGPRRLPRPPRFALTAAVACIALVALAVIALALPGGDRATTPGGSHSALPRQCDAAAGRGRLRLVSAPVDSGLLATYAILRRPQTAADRTTCPATAQIGRLNPAAIRRAGSDPDGHPLFLVPMASVPDMERAFRRGDPRPPWEIPDMTGPRLCPTIVYPNSGAGGNCYPPSFFGRGRFLPASSRTRISISIGLFSDAVAAVDVRFFDGSLKRFEITDNVAVLKLEGRTATPANSVAGYRLLDEHGATIAERGADRGLRPSARISAAGRPPGP
ncbi:hypothetical protein [Conexibacter sp. CPCC 206217]|uniref:hypothetical protein n=1 Tax=Conexibacter sp. CPCC 206217 TaxID=3064574 RepID=UPI00271B8DB1|nr:hypothetical protein [Conexibacter sp. CPCC 206217]MDO8209341.1 hypothetical protein [Conexibacter sp. CPCC 206217]